MMVSAGAQGVVVGARRLVVLNARPSPMIESLTEPRLARVPHVHKRRTFPAAFGDRRGTGVRPQGDIITIGQRASRFCEHRGGHHSSDAWQRLENLGVTMLARLRIGGLKATSEANPCSMRRSATVRCAWTRRSGGTSEAIRASTASATPAARATAAGAPRRSPRPRSGGECGARAALTPDVGETPGPERRDAECRRARSTARARWRRDRASARPRRRDTTAPATDWPAAVPRSGAPRRSGTLTQLNDRAASG